MHRPSAPPSARIDIDRVTFARACLTLREFASEVFVPVTLLSAVTPLGGHAVFLLLIQLALLLIVARAGAETAKRAGLPSVVGELAAGIVLGPTVFGHFAPHAFAAVFPAVSDQFHLLEVVGMLGMVLLLLLTGLETDLKLLKNLGRAAMVASIMGMAVPFAMGYGLGFWMPDSYVAHPEHRYLFSAFLATAMSISAMPVIAKILMDLDLARRNIGLVILSAGVVDDTAGWLILSVIAGVASSGVVKISGLAFTLGWLTLYLAVIALVVYPITRWLLRIAAQFRSPDADLVAIIVVTFLSAAVTEHIGVHAVFGAFIAGTMFRQVTALNHETVHKLETFVFAILAPIFFGIVGLKVDLWRLGGGSMLAIVLAVATLGKLAGCTIGGLWGGLRFWEAFSIAVAMNARGAMELVVASIGLALGILNQQMFSIIVMVAIITSFMASVLLRLTMRMVRMTDEEAKRILAEKSTGAFDPARLRVLLPTAGGPNALEAARVGFQIAKRSEHPLDVVFVDAKFTRIQRLWNAITRKRTGEGIQAHLGAIRELAGESTAPSTREVVSPGIADTIIEEANKGFDLLLVGASQRGAALGGGVLEDVMERAPCHVGIVRAAATPREFKRVLVPIDGGTASRVAADFAARLAEAAGAELTLAVLSEQRPPTSAYAEEDGGSRTRTASGGWALPTPIRASTRPAAPTARSENPPRMRKATPTPMGIVRGGASNAALAVVPPVIEQTEEEEAERISPVFRTTEKRPRLVHLEYDATSNVVLKEIARGNYDLVVIGAENRAVQHRLFFGYENQRVITASPVSVVVVVPNIARLK